MGCLTQVRVQALKVKTMKETMHPVQIVGICSYPQPLEITHWLYYWTSQRSTFALPSSEKTAPEFGQVSEADTHPRHKSRAWIFLLLHSRSLEQGPQTSRELYWVFCYDCGLYCFMIDFSEFKVQWIQRKMCQ